MIIVVMGVAGSGKSTIGRLLADALGCDFLEGDALHPAANIDRMSRGVALTDDDREPWLAVVRARMLDAAARGQSLVVACSALKEAYRDYLADGVAVTWVYLKGSPELIRGRLARRTGHFAKPELLASQVAALEEPAGAIVADIALPPAAIVGDIIPRLR